jgi:hypothetical protein
MQFVSGALRFAGFMTDKTRMLANTGKLSRKIVGMLVVFSFSPPAPSASPCSFPGNWKALPRPSTMPAASACEPTAWAT